MLSINQGARHDNGLVPVRLHNYYKNHMPGELCGVLPEEAERLKELKAADILVKMQVLRDGKIAGEDKFAGDFIAVTEEKAKQIEKAKAPLAKRCVPGGDAAPEPPPKPE
jgi:hypothetical protein